jgi:WD40 repeat protein
MSAPAAALRLAVCLVGALGSVWEASAADPGAAPVAPRTDRFGDPLPPGALFRFGSLRFRHPEGINSSALSLDGKLLATTAKTSVAVWDLKTGRCVRWFRDCGIPDGFNGLPKVAFSPDGRQLAHLCESDVAARVWDVESGKAITAIGHLPHKELPGAGQPLPPRAPGVDYDDASTICFTPDGRGLELFSDKSLTIFDPSTQARQYKAPIPAEPVGFSWDGSHFAALARPKGREPGLAFLAICSARTGKEETRFPMSVEAADYHTLAGFAPDGKTVAMASGGPELRIWEIATGKELRCFQLRPLPESLTESLRYTVVRYSPDGRYVFAGTQGNAIIRYDLNGSGETILSGHSWWVTGLHTVAGGSTLYSTSWDNTIRRWDIATGKEAPLPEGYTGGTTAIHSPDAKQIAVADLSGRLEVWEVARQRRLRTLQTKGSGICRVAFAPDGKTLVAGCRDGVIRRWEPRTGQLLDPLGMASRPAEDWFQQVVFSPDGSRLLACSRRHELTLWDVTAKKPIWTTQVKDDSTAAFSPDGKIIATGGWKSLLSFRDPVTGNARYETTVPVDPKPRGHGTIIDSIAYSPNGRLLATTHHDGLIRLWDAAGRELKRLRGHQDPAWVARFSPDGKWLVSGGVDGTCRIWEVATGEEVYQLVGHDAWIHHVEFGPRAQTVLTAGGPQALLWDARPSNRSAISMDSLWNDLRAADAARAYRAVWAIADQPREAAAFLRRVIAPVTAENPKRLAELIGDLDSDRFATREAASRALAGLGQRAEPALREAARKPVSTEAKRRLLMLLEVLDREPGPEDLRRSRAVQALELAGTPEARRVLTRWAGGAPGARLTEDARCALARLGMP